MIENSLKDIHKILLVVRQNSGQLLYILLEDTVGHCNSDFNEKMEDTLNVIIFSASIQQQHIFEKGKIIRGIDVH